MNNVERFRAVMNFQPVDRLPLWEWAMWWDETIARWKTEGLPERLNGVFEISQYFGLDPYIQFWFSTTETTIEAKQHHVEGIVSNMDDYLAVVPRLYPSHDDAVAAMQPWAEQQTRGDAVVWATFEGFFWFTRTLMGFEKLMYAYYDQPELIHRINRDLLDFHVRTLRKMTRRCTPTFVTLAEDMSYNHGPMISRGIFDEFLAPYYRRFLPLLEELNVTVIVDTDGDVTRLAPWLQDVGVAGILPLERQSGVDGEPVSVTDAAALATDDPYQFQWWALGLVNARPVEQKKGADRGIDGRLFFHDEAESGKTKQVIISVKAGNTGPAHVRDLRGVVEREKAAMGLLITMEDPTAPMRKEAASAGFYDSPWGTKHPRIQILTVGELLEGKMLDAPPSRDIRTFKKAPRAVKKPKDSQREMLD